MIKTKPPAQTLEDFELLPYEVFDQGEFELTPDEVILQPTEYELPEYIKGSYRNHQEKMKQSITVTRKQIQYFGERGASWLEIEKFYNVSRTTLQRYYLRDYEKGYALTNIALRNRQVVLALSGNPTMLVWTGKQRLGQSDAGPVGDITDEDTGSGVEWKSKTPAAPDFGVVHQVLDEDTDE